MLSCRKIGFLCSTRCGYCHRQTCLNVQNINENIAPVAMLVQKMRNLENEQIHKLVEVDIEVQITIDEEEETEYFLLILLLFLFSI